MLRIVRPASPASHLRQGFLLPVRPRPALPAAGKQRPVSRVSRARACVPGCARFAAARFARLIARARRHPGGPATGHGMSCSPCAPRTSYGLLGHTAAMSGKCSGSSVRPPRGFASSARVPPFGPTSSCAPRRREAAPCFARIASACAPAPGCARFAAARFARPIARARRALRIVRPASPASHLRQGSLLPVRPRPALPAAGKPRPVSRVSRACPAARVSRRRGSRA